MLNSPTLVNKIMGRPKRDKVQASVNTEYISPAAPVEDKVDKIPITPATDQCEMDRVFRVINNRGHALSICKTISHQRDLNLWGVHQYADESQNSFARSFYFRDRNNAQKVLDYAEKLLA